MIGAGAFREDLYYRLNTIEIRVPPLAERIDDILPLARHFLAAGKRLTADAHDALRRHPWPGNVRELKNALQRLTLLATGDDIGATDLALPEPRGRTAVAAPAAHAPHAPPSAAHAAPSAPHPGPVDEEPDRTTIEAALARAGGVIAQAAAELGLSRQALYRRMEKLSILRE